MKIEEETAERIVFLIRLSHPNEKGELYTRYDVVKEIVRRGLGILKELGWNTSIGTIWKNRYTGSEETFAERMNFKKDEHQKAREEGMFHELPYTIEHWTPKEIWTDVDCHSEYKEKATLNGWIK